MRKVHADFIGVNYIVLVVFEVIADTLQDISIDIGSRLFSISTFEDGVSKKVIGESIYEEDLFSNVNDFH